MGFAGETAAEVVFCWVIQRISRAGCKVKGGGPEAGLQHRHKNSPPASGSGHDAGRGGTWFLEKGIRRGFSAALEADDGAAKSGAVQSLQYW